MAAKAKTGKKLSGKMHQAKPSTKKAGDKVRAKSAAKSAKTAKSAAAAKSRKPAKPEKHPLAKVTKKKVIVAASKSIKAKPDAKSKPKAAAPTAERHKPATVVKAHAPAKAAAGKAAPHAAAHKPAPSPKLPAAAAKPAAGKPAAAGVKAPAAKPTAAAPAHAAAKPSAAAPVAPIVASTKPSGESLKPVVASGLAKAPGLKTMISKEALKAAALKTGAAGPAPIKLMPQAQAVQPGAARPAAPVAAPRPAGAPVAAVGAARPPMAAAHPGAQRPAGTSAGQAADAAKKKAMLKPANQRHGFKTGEYIVYPTHGVGKIVGIEEQVVAGYSLELFVINFEHEKMTLRVPTAKLAAVGMRKLSEEPVVTRAMETLKGRARIKRTMWSRRAQEYEQKINSGDLVAIAEVVRDLYRAETQPEQSYSERQLFEAALDRMAREIAAVEKLDERGAHQKVLDVLAKSARGRRAAEEAAAAATVASAPAAGQAA